MLLPTAAVSRAAALLPALPRAGAAHMVVAPDAAALLLADSALGATADELAGSLFGASLFPWLAMLYWLKHPLVKAPSGVSFGLTYLLAFVFGSIPAAIGAGAMYGVSLADSDYLHGAAESLLAITNCVVVLGFRAALAPGASSSTDGTDDASTARLRTVATALGGLAALSAVFVVASGGASVHVPWLGGIGNLPSSVWAEEPANALSVPTWIIHTSSLVEWLVAMGLAWRYAEVSGRSEWKGVTWGMLPLHTSGIVACTYHLFYNAPAITWCVALQAGMTCVGNTTLAYACLRLALACGWTWEAGKADALALKDEAMARVGAVLGEEAMGARAQSAARTDATDEAAVARAADAAPRVSDAAVAVEGDAATAAAAALVGWEDLGDAWQRDSDVAFLIKLLALSGALAYLVKYTPIALFAVGVTEGVPPEVVSALALLVIFVPTGLNVAKWRQRSKEGSEFVGDF